MYSEKILKKNSRSALQADGLFAKLVVKNCVKAVYLELTLLKIAKAMFI